MVGFTRDSCISPGNIYDNVHNSLASPHVSFQGLTKSPLDTTKAFVQSQDIDGSRSSDKIFLQDTDSFPSQKSISKDFNRDKFYFSPGFHSSTTSQLRGAPHSDKIVIDHNNYSHQRSDFGKASKCGSLPFICTETSLNQVAMSDPILACRDNNVLTDHVDHLGDVFISANFPPPVDSGFNLHDITHSGLPRRYTPQFVGGFRLVKGGKISHCDNLPRFQCVDPIDNNNFSDIIAAHNLVVKSGQHNFQYCRIPVNNHLNHDLWSLYLSDYHDKELLEFLKFGFPVGYDKDILPASLIRNHKGAIDFGKEVSQYIQKEIQAGVLAGPFSSNPLNFPLSISPLNTVPKRNNIDRRVISDLSFPPGYSVNDGIPKGQYLHQQISLSYPSVDNLAYLIKKSGPASLLFKKDLKRAYRQFMVDPGDIHLLGYLWEDKIYIDLALAMGIRSAAFLCQRITDAIKHIFKSHGFNMVNYIDDLAGLGLPKDAYKAYNTLGVILSDLGVEEAQEKSCPPSPVMEFLGVEFHVPSMSMRVTPERVQEILCLVESWLQKKKASKRELQSLIGKLQFVSKCIRPGRIFVSRLLLLLPSLSKPHHKFHITIETRKDLLWWRKFLTHFNGVSLIPDMIWSSPDSVFSTDACLQSAGGFCQQEYFSAAFPQFIISQNFNINILELLTIMVAIKVWGHNIKDRRVQIYCDNQASCIVLNSGRTKNPIMLSIIREIAYLSTMFNCQIRALHISGVNNRMADLMSRAPIDNNSKRLLESELNEGWKRLPVQNDLFLISNDW
jgi:hypothetical protein